MGVYGYRDSDLARDGWIVERVYPVSEERECPDLQGDDHGTDCPLCGGDDYLYRPGYVEIIYRRAE